MKACSRLRNDVLRDKIPDEFFARGSNERARTWKKRFETERWWPLVKKAALERPRKDMEVQATVEAAGGKHVAKDFTRQNLMILTPEEEQDFVTLVRNGAAVDKEVTRQEQRQWVRKALVLRQRQQQTKNNVTPLSMTAEKCLQGPSLTHPSNKWFRQLFAKHDTKIVMKKVSCDDATRMKRCTQSAAKAHLERLFVELTEMRTPVLDEHNECTYRTIVNADGIEEQELITVVRVPSPAPARHTLALSPARHMHRALAYAPSRALSS
jgi:hypothetical protein